MIRRIWRDRGIAARLLAIVVLPAAIMFIAVAATLYVTTLNEVRRDVADRGRLIATALAQSSQYGLVSGNVGYLRLTLRDLRQADASIACVEIADGAGRLLVSDCRRDKPGDAIAHALPIRLAATPNADLFDPDPPTSAAAASPTRTIGHVRVTMSPAPILMAKHKALLVAFALVLAATVASCLVGLHLAKRLRRTLGAVMSALRAIRQGRFDVRLDTHQAGELGELQRTIVQMAETLNAARHELEQQVATRTQELQSAVDRVRQADAEKRRLITHSNAAVEEERRRIAVDIHDHLGAALISVKLEASALAARAHSLGDQEMERDARRIAATTDSVYATTRNIVKRLRPEIIDTLGLSGAIEELVRHMDTLQSGCHFAFSAGEGLPYLRGEVAMPAYRITQEAINNIVKHAHATQAKVRLTLAPGLQHLCIEIRDNGCGFEPCTPGRSGLGLIGMRERVAAVDGTLDIASAPGQGTLLRVTLPLCA
jgi:two-component system sensor histidine kinase UhpB